LGTGGIAKPRVSFITTEGDCGAMKIVILITVIESSAIVLAILYFYYRRSQSRKRALVSRRPSVSITEQAQAKVVLPSAIEFNSGAIKGGYKI
jgi:hypothetical protein